MRILKPEVMSWSSSRRVIACIKRLVGVWQTTLLRLQCDAMNRSDAMIESLKKIDLKTKKSSHKSIRRSRLRLCHP